jgi:hypothetical protein
MLLLTYNTQRQLVSHEPMEDMHVQGPARAPWGPSSALVVDDSDGYSILFGTAEYCRGYWVHIFLPGHAR